MANAQYSGGCHCGAVRYSVEADLDRTMKCNCSRCRGLGGPLTFTGEDKFSLESGEDNLTDYLFNKHAIHHLFCKTCGIESFARGTTPKGEPMMAINVCCLDGVDLETLRPQKIDGAKF